MKRNWSASVGRLILISVLLLGALVYIEGKAARGITDGPALPSPREDTSPLTRLEISYAQGLLSLDLRDAQLADVLRRIADKTGIALTIGEGVGGRVSLTLTGVPLETAIRRLAASHAIIYEYDPAKRTMRVIGAGAFGAGNRRAEASEEKCPASFPFPPVSQVPQAGGEEPPEIVAPKSPPEEPLYDRKRRPLYKPREILVQFRPEATAAQMAALHQSLGSIVLKRIDHLMLHLVLVPEGLSEKEAVALYEASEIVISAERHALRYPLTIPNDPHYESQWGLKKIGLEAAWSVTYGRPEIVIAVIDTGIDSRHPDLAPNIWTNPAEVAGNGLDDDQNGFIDDVQGWDFSGKVQPNGDNDPGDPDGHGTHVAGIIAALGNNGIGVAGIGWRLRVMPLKVMADGQSTMELFDIIQALDYARRQGARIVNCSFGSSSFSQLEYEAYKRLRQAGIMAVCAAGNGGINNDTHRERTYPASYSLDNIISVASSNREDELSPNSNYGKVSVDLMAPGVDILSTGLCPTNAPCDSLATKSGTSMATPHVSGVAGLIFSRNPHLKYSRVKSLLLKSVEKMESVAEKLVSGGRLHAARALELVCLPGDVRSDGRVDLADVILALRVAAGLDEPALACLTADINGDDRIGLAEALYGLQILSGKRAY